jgi:hypothetical protein
VDDIDSNIARVKRDRRHVNERGVLLRTLVMLQRLLVLRRASFFDVGGSMIFARFREQNLVNSTLTDICDEIGS